MADFELIVKPALWSAGFLFVMGLGLWLRGRVRATGEGADVRAVSRGLLVFAGGAGLLAGFQAFNALFALIVG